MGSAHVYRGVNQVVSIADGPEIAIMDRFLAPQDRTPETVLAAQKVGSPRHTALLDLISVRGVVERVFEAIGKELDDVYFLAVWMVLDSDCAKRGALSATTRSLPPRSVAPLLAGILAIAKIGWDVAARNPMQLANLSGTQRVVYRCNGTTCQGSDHITFNSIVNAGNGGGERKFVNAKVAGARGGFSNELHVRPGQVVLVRAYVNNEQLRNEMLDSC